MFIIKVGPSMYLKGVDPMLKYIEQTTNRSNAVAFTSKVGAERYVRDLERKRLGFWAHEAQIVQVSL